MILLIDNYDSFSYNLYQLIGSIDNNIKVIRNDEMTVNQIKDLAPDVIIVSPGPGKPIDAGICIDAIKELGQTIPTLGVCLGHQSICQAFGGTVSYAKQLMHGKQSTIKIDTSSKLFSNLPERIDVARYHSLAAIDDNFPSCLKITAKTDDGEIMALEHTEYPIYGVQFHPESILTPCGKTILENFINIANNN